MLGCVELLVDDDISPAPSTENGCFLLPDDMLGDIRGRDVAQQQVFPQ